MKTKSENSAQSAHSARSTRSLAQFLGKPKKNLLSCFSPDSIEDNLVGIYFLDTLSQAEVKQLVSAKKSVKEMQYQPWPQMG